MPARRGRHAEAGVLAEHLHHGLDVAAVPRVDITLHDFAHSLVAERAQSCLLASLWQTLLGAREEEAEPVVSEPILRRLSDDELTLVEAADLFNQSDFRRTVAGVTKSLGDPKVSIVPLTGVNAETVLTFAWDITWYQYRVTPDAAQPVRIADRGHDLGEVEPAYAHWNARFDETGRLVPDLVTA